MNIVIDTNIFISALIKNSITRGLIVNSQHSLLFPEFEFIEIKRHKQEILEKSGMLDEEFRDLFFNLLKYVKIVKTEKTINYKEQAFNIIGNIDKDDVELPSDLIGILYLPFNNSIFDVSEKIRQRLKGQGVIL